MNINIIKKGLLIKIRQKQMCLRRDCFFDWMAVCVFGVILFGGSIIAGFYINSLMSKGVGADKAQVKKMETINRGMMDEVVGYFENQKKIFDETKNLPVEWKDPSR